MTGEAGSECRILRLLGVLCLDVVTQRGPSYSQQLTCFLFPPLAPSHTVRGHMQTCVAMPARKYIQVPSRPLHRNNGAPWHLSDLGVHTVEAQFFQRKASMSSRSRFRGARQEIPGSQVSGVWFRRARGLCKGISPRPTDFSPRGKGWGGRKPRAKPSGVRGQSMDFFYPGVIMVLEPAIGLSQPGST